MSGGDSTLAADGTAASSTWSSEGGTITSTSVQTESESFDSLTTPGIAPSPMGCTYEEVHNSSSYESTGTNAYGNQSLAQANSYSDGTHSSVEQELCAEVGGSNGKGNASQYRVNVTTGTIGTLNSVTALAGAKATVDLTSSGNSYSSVVSNKDGSHSTSDGGGGTSSSTYTQDGSRSLHTEYKSYTAGNYSSSEETGDFHKQGGDYSSSGWSDTTVTPAGGSSTTTKVASSGDSSYYSYKLDLTHKDQSHTSGTDKFFNCGFSGSDTSHKNATKIEGTYDYVGSSGSVQITQTGGSSSTVNTGGSVTDTFTKVDDSRTGKSESWGPQGLFWVTEKSTDWSTTKGNNTVHSESAYAGSSQTNANGTATSASVNYVKVVGSGPTDRESDHDSTRTETFFGPFYDVRTTKNWNHSISNATDSAGIEVLASSSYGSGGGSMIMAMSGGGTAYSVHDDDHQSAYTQSYTEVSSGAFSSGTITRNSGRSGAGHLHVETVSSATFGPQSSSQKHFLTSDYDNYKYGRSATHVGTSGYGFSSSTTDDWMTRAERGTMVNGNYNDVTITPQSSVTVNMYYDGRAERHVEDLGHIGTSQHNWWTPIYASNGKSFNSDVYGAVGGSSSFNQTTTTTTVSGGQTTATTKSLSMSASDKVYARVTYHSSESHSTWLPFPGTSGVSNSDSWSVGGSTLSGDEDFNTVDGATKFTRNQYGNNSSSSHSDGSTTLPFYSSSYWSNNNSWGNSSLNESGTSGTGGYNYANLEYHSLSHSDSRGRNQASGPAFSSVHDDSSWSDSWKDVSGSGTSATQVDTSSGGGWWSTTVNGVHTGGPWNYGPNATTTTISLVSGTSQFYNSNTRPTINIPSTFVDGVWDTLGVWFDSGLAAFEAYMSGYARVAYGFGVLGPYGLARMPYELAASLIDLVAVGYGIFDPYFQWDPISSVGQTSMAEMDRGAPWWQVSLENLGDVVTLGTYRPAKQAIQTGNYEDLQFAVGAAAFNVALIVATEGLARGTTGNCFVAGTQVVLAQDSAEAAALPAANEDMSGGWSLGYLALGCTTLAVGLGLEARRRSRRRCEEEDREDQGAIDSLFFGAADDPDPWWDESLDEVASAVCSPSRDSQPTVDLDALCDALFHGPPNQTGSLAIHDVPLLAGSRNSAAGVRVVERPRTRTSGSRQDVTPAGSQAAPSAVTCRPSPGRNRTGIRQFWAAAALLLLGSTLLWKALPSGLPRPEPTSSAGAVAAAPARPSQLYTTASIETLREGDRVLAMDPQTGLVQPRQVTATFRRLADHLCVLQMRAPNGSLQEIKTTDEHPFWVVPEDVFKNAAELVPGDAFLGPNGELQILDISRREYHPGGVSVYNIETEQDHTYFVASLGRNVLPVLVHNCIRTGAFTEGVEGFGHGLGGLAGRNIRVTPRGLSVVENHLRNFGSNAANEAMLGRLRAAMAEGRRVSGADASFYMHELAESTMVRRLMAQGSSFEAAQEMAHLAAFKKYGVSPFSVYHIDVIRMLLADFNENWVNFWEGQP
ncbi:MAG: polymorphic toxin-type HINT domain-containing protein [Pirellulaceae bacterium]